MWEFGMKSLSAMFVSIGLCWGLALPAAWAQDKIYQDISANEISQILDKADITNSVTTGKEGEPMVLVEQGDLKFLIRGIDCNAGSDAKCSKIQFRGSIKMKEYPSSAWMNEFNRKWIFGKAYVSPDGIAHVEYPINLQEGITEANLLNNFILWGIILDTFIEHLDGGEIAPMM
ncbi:MAG: YbjN domain-containing protein [Alphaproteobacteria bacterium]|nr:MAG: YbjN domain-containing protein [Alphaproteobacteria bacterium]